MKYVISLYKEYFNTGSMFYRLPAVDKVGEVVKDIIVDDLSFTQNYISFKYKNETYLVSGCKLIAKEMK